MILVLKNLRYQILTNSAKNETQAEKDNKNLTKTLTAIKKIVLAEIIARLPGEVDERNDIYARGLNSYREETIKLLKSMCGVE